MPKIQDQVADLASSVGQSEPVIQIAKGISSVGQTASDAYDTTKKWVGKKVQQLTPTTTPATPPPADIELLKEKKAKRPITRSLSKR